MDSRLQPFVVIVMFLFVFAALLYLVPDPTHKSLPEKPTTLTNDTIRDYITEYESAYVNNEILEQRGNLEALDMTIMGISVNKTKYGYRVDASSYLSTGSTWYRYPRDEHSYRVTYFINASTIKRSSNFPK